MKRFEHDKEWKKSIYLECFKNKCNITSPFKEVLHDKNPNKRYQTLKTNKSKKNKILLKFSIIVHKKDVLFYDYKIDSISFFISVKEAKQII